MNATTIKLVIKLWHDDMPCDPCEYGWKVHSFSHRHANFTHPGDFDGDEELARKLKIGLAFPLSYYEHGQCLWSLGGELPPGAILEEEAVARMFNRHPASVKRAVERGELPPPVRLFGKPAWTAGAILAHMDARLAAAKREAEREAARISRLSP